MPGRGGIPELVAVDVDLIEVAIVHNTGKYAPEHSPSQGLEVGDAPREAVVRVLQGEGIQKL